MGEEASQKANIPEFSVGEVSAALKRTVEREFGLVRVRGEISGYRGPHSSGHAYFKLKENDAVIDAVCFKGAFSKNRSKISEGLEVIATGKVTTYAGKSSYQIIIEHVEPAGIGALMQLLEERRKKLAAEGLFNEDRKKPIPLIPETIGVITSPTGAVIRDILHRLSERFPRRVLLWPVSVQGDKSAAEVAAAIEGFNALAPNGAVPRPDVLIVARGGGSIEDLWPFNEEIVVRAAAASAIPLISAVGHETDTTLIDYASDRRAPTPTAAAEMAVPVRAEKLRDVSALAVRMQEGLLRTQKDSRQRLLDLTRALPRPQRLLEGPRQRFDFAASHLSNALTLLVQRQRTRLERAGAGLSAGPLRRSAKHNAERLESLQHRLRLSAGRSLQDCTQRLALPVSKLNALNYKSTLARGFAMVTGKSRKLITSRDKVAGGDELNITFFDGDVTAVATGGPTPGGKPPAKPKTGSQGDLF